jgi:hypothetical protein
MPRLTQMGLTRVVIYCIPVDCPRICYWTHRDRYQVTGFLFSVQNTSHKIDASASINWFFLQQQLEAEWLKHYAIAYKMLAHGFDPMQPQTVQHGTRTFHHAENSYCKEEPVAS